MVVSPVGLETKNYCAGKGQQQLNSQSWVGQLSGVKQLVGELVRGLLRFSRCELLL
jgi:hypothetical protein